MIKSNTKIQPTWSMGTKDLELRFHGLEFKRIINISQCIVGCPILGPQGKP